MHAGVFDPLWVNKSKILPRQDPTLKANVVKYTTSPKRIEINKTAKELLIVAEMCSPSVGAKLKPPLNIFK